MWTQFNRYLLNKGFMRFSYKRALDELKEYAINEGYSEVVTDHNDISVLYWNMSTLNEPVGIYIEGRHTWEIKTYLMLHELGHHQLRKNWKKFEKRFPVIAKAQKAYYIDGIKRYMRRTDYIVACLEEEYAAWEEALKLGEKFNIKINMSKWIMIKSKCLKGYINYYAILKR